VTMTESLSDPDRLDYRFLRAETVRGQTLPIGVAYRLGRAGPEVVLWIPEWRAPRVLGVSDVESLSDAQLPAIPVYGDRLTWGRMQRLRSFPTTASIADLYLRELERGELDAARAVAVESTETESTESESSESESSENRESAAGNGPTLPDVAAASESDFGEEVSDSEGAYAFPPPVRGVARPYHGVQDPAAIAAHHEFAERLYRERRGLESLKDPEAPEGGGE
jgi:hypothetical protein